MASDKPDYATQIPIDDSESPFISRNRCCFHFPCFSGGGAATYSAEDGWFSRPIRAFKKVREWSERVAGPKWKTFIRRFNRNQNIRHQQSVGGKFQYDPLSYALNFDEGPGQNDQFNEEYGNFPDFSSRYVVSAKSSMDLTNGNHTFE